MSIDFSSDQGVAWITLNRPEALNAFDIPDLEDLHKALQEAGRDPDIRVVAISGTGRAFSVGADIKAMDKMTEQDFAKAASLYQALAQTCRQMDKPILGAVNGYALGGGFEVALMCDLRIADESAQFGLPDAQLGFSPTGGLTWLLVRIVGLGRALDMALTTDRVDASQALAMGLVSRVVPHEQLHSELKQLAIRIAQFPKTGLRNIKRSFYHAAETAFSATLALEEAYDSDCFRSVETQQQLKAFIESRQK